MTISKALLSSNHENWATPRDFFYRLNHEFNFTLDACASADNHKCDRYFTKEQDALSQDWGTERVFMNPPYGKNIGLWMRKAVEAARGGALVVCLVHARTDTKWWHENVQGLASEVRFVRGRLKFGGSKHNAPFPSAVVIYRPKCES